MVAWLSNYMYSPDSNEAYSCNCHLHIIITQTPGWLGRHLNLACAWLYTSTVSLWHHILWSITHLFVNHSSHNITVSCIDQSFEISVYRSMSNTHPLLFIADRSPLSYLIWWLFGFIWSKTQLSRCQTLYSYIQLGMCACVAIVGILLFVV